MKKVILGASLIAMTVFSFNAAAFNGSSATHDGCCKDKSCCVDNKCDTGKCKGGKCDHKGACCDKDKKSCTTPASGGSGCCAPKSNQPK